MPVAPSFELFGRDGSLFALGEAGSGGGEAGGGESEAWGLLLR